MSRDMSTCHAILSTIWSMEKRARGRPRTVPPDQKREAVRKRQQERRQRLAEAGGRSITLAVPGDLLTALDGEAKQRGITRSELLIECARTQIDGSEPASEGGAADPGSRIPGSQPRTPEPEVQINRSGPRVPHRWQLLAALGLGAVLGSWDRPEGRGGGARSTTKLRALGLSLYQCALAEQGRVRVPGRALRILGSKLVGLKSVRTDAGGKRSR
jgi:hypothetical protein